MISLVVHIDAYNLMFNRKMTKTTAFQTYTYFSKCSPIGRAEAVFYSKETGK